MIDDIEKVKTAIAFYKRMAQKSRAEASTGSDFRQGQMSGAAVAWSVAAELLEDTFGLTEKEEQHGEESEGRNGCSKDIHYPSGSTHQQHDR